MPGEEDLPSNASKALEIALALGVVQLICSVAGHYAAGMVAPLAMAAGSACSTSSRPKRQLVGRAIPSGGRSDDAAAPG